MSATQETRYRSVKHFYSEEDLKRALTSREFTKSECSDDDALYRRHKHPAQLVQQLGWPKRPRTTEGSKCRRHDPECAKALDWVMDTYDDATTEIQSVDEELPRLQVLNSFQLLDCETSEAFDRITGLASRIFHCPISVISLVDLGRQWLVSNRGLGDLRETDRKHSFCAHTIIGMGDFLIVPDTTKDIRFCDNPMVTGPENIRFYTGAPLLSPEGYRLGALGILDTKPRTAKFSLTDKQNLKELAALAVTALVDHRRQKLDMGEYATDVLGFAANDILVPTLAIHSKLISVIQDEAAIAKLAPQQRDLLDTAFKSILSMAQKCSGLLPFSTSPNEDIDNECMVQKKEESLCQGIEVLEFVTKLYRFLDPFPKQAPVIITVDTSVPDKIFTDESKLFWSAINFLMNACNVTKTGSIRMFIYANTERHEIVIECEDTGPNVPVSKYPQLFRPVKESEECPTCDVTKKFGVGTSDLAYQYDMNLYSVAVRISSIGGKYGFRPRTPSDSASKKEQQTGSIFWMSIPQQKTDTESDKLDSGLNSNSPFSRIHRLNKSDADALVRELKSLPLSSQEERLVNRTKTNAQINPSTKATACVGHRLAASSRDMSACLHTASKKSGSLPDVTMTKNRKII